MFLPRQLEKPANLKKAQMEMLPKGLAFKCLQTYIKLIFRQNIICIWL